MHAPTFASTHASTHEFTIAPTQPRTWLLHRLQRAPAKPSLESLRCRRSVVGSAARAASRARPA
eukprot:6172409-Pleurochrysis_carterae.AAC.1